MFLLLAHTRLDIFPVSRSLVLQCYQVTRLFPPEERFCLVPQARRAALSVHFNLSEGCSRRSGPERRRFFEISRGSVVEVDTAFDIALALGYCTPEALTELGKTIIKTFKILSGLISQS
ncbi:MAG: ribosomal protein [Flaviaesturariibacter sp.]|nr:ribosomal protein [Flaviaesturariibacter sp.]